MKKFALSLLIGVIVLGNAATPTYAAENFFQKFSNSMGTRLQRLYLNVIPGSKSGKSVMEQAMKESEKVTSAEMKANIDLDLQDDGRSLGKMKMTLSGPFEAKDPQDPSTMKYDMNVAGEVSMQGTSMRASADMKLAGENIFIKVNEVPALPVNLDPIKGKWLKTKNTSTTSTTKLSAEDMQKMKEAYQKLWEQAQLSQAKKETKNGKAVYVVEATLPKQALTEYINSIMQIQSKSGSMTNFDETQFRQSLDKAMESVGEVKATVWVDRATFNMVHTEVPLTFTLPARESTLSPAAAASNPLASLSNVDTVLLNVTVDMDKFNKPITFTEPTDAQDLEQAVQEMMMSNSTMPSSAAPTELPEMTPQQRLQLQRMQQQQQLQQLKELEDETSTGDLFPR